MVASASLPFDPTPSAPRLPEGWSAPELVEDVIVADGLSVCRAGIAITAPDGEEVTGSAAALEQGRKDGDTSPAMRARYELLERASIVEAVRSPAMAVEIRTATGGHVRTCSARDLFPESSDPSRWRYARSNGVAVHGDWSSACERALWELAERDRILASWYGEVQPVRLDASLAPCASTTRYEWSAWVFPEARGCRFSRGLDVVGVFGFPTSPEAPLAMGFAARPERGAALDDATREAIQVMAFLWGEPVPPTFPAMEPTAMGHLDFHQVRDSHRILRSWLAGDHLTYGRGDAGRGDSGPSVDGMARDAVLFADLTPPWLDGGLRVAMALCPTARPLVFGDSPFGAHLPPERRIHPIS